MRPTLFRVSLSLFLGVLLVGSLQASTLVKSSVSVKPLSSEQRTALREDLKEQLRNRELKKLDAQVDHVVDEAMSQFDTLRGSTGSDSDIGFEISDEPLMIVPTKGGGSGASCSGGCRYVTDARNCFYSVVCNTANPSAAAVDECLGKAKVRMEASSYYNASNCM